MTSCRTHSSDKHLRIYGLLTGRGYGVARETRKRQMWEVGLIAGRDSGTCFPAIKPVLPGCIGSLVYPHAFPSAIAIGSLTGMFVTGHIGIHHVVILV
jgi:hypothetical protein